MNDRPQPRQPVAAGVSFPPRGIVPERDGMLEEEALAAMDERGRLGRRAIVGATPGREVELACLT